MMMTPSSTANVPKLTPRDFCGDPDAGEGVVVTADATTGALCMEAATGRPPIARRVASSTRRSDVSRTSACMASSPLLMSWPLFGE